MCKFEEAYAAYDGADSNYGKIIVDLKRRKLENIIAENGALSNQKDKLMKDNVRLNQQYNVLLQKSSGNQLIKNKISAAKKYIDSLKKEQYE